MKLDLEKDISQEMNKKSPVISYDLPYVLLKHQEESLKALVENAPTAYSLEIKESPCYPNGISICLEYLEESA